MSLSLHPNTLLHASLAYLSPESRFFDSLIRHRSLSAHQQHPSSLLSLPSELLLLIRTHLHHALTAHLIDQTQHALEEYEHTMRALLCPDCRSYNDDVFGSSVWSWEGFCGPCSCGGSPDRDGRVQPEGTLFPKHFLDRQHWIEAHLARQHLLTTPSSPLVSVWNAVDDVLGEFGCTLIKDALNPSFVTGRGRVDRSASAGGVLALLRNWGGRAMISTTSFVPCRPRYLTVVPCSLSDAYPKEREEVVLNRIKRELGLDLDFGSEEMEREASPPLPPAHTKREREHVLSTHPLSILPALVSLRVLAQTVFACLTMPFAFVVTVLCFYCTPGTLRLF
jgi:hypothetical protein